jgi:hypothetical protein
MSPCRSESYIHRGSGEDGSAWAVHRFHTGFSSNATAISPTDYESETCSESPDCVTAIGRPPDSRSAPGCSAQQPPGQQDQVCRGWSQPPAASIVSPGSRRELVKQTGQRLQTLELADLLFPGLRTCWSIKKPSTPTIRFTSFLPSSVFLIFAKLFLLLSISITALDSLSPAGISPLSPGTFIPQ